MNIEPNLSNKSHQGGNSGSPSQSDLDLERRLAAIEEKLNHMATKASVLAGVVGGCMLAVGIAMTYLRLFG